ncbi:MAG TPA: hypothetical protein DHV85_02820 [Candidatus Accumulibacter sp.]|nr:hypothetical protein [Accumulibacter sp.]
MGNCLDAQARSLIIAHSINWRTTAGRPVDDQALPGLIRDPGFMIEGKLLAEIVHACADRLASKMGGMPTASA